MIPNEFNTTVNTAFPFVWSTQLNLIHDGEVVAFARYHVPLFFRKNQVNLHYNGGRLPYSSNIKNALANIVDFYVFFKDIILGTENFQERALSSEPTNPFQMKMLDYYFGDWMASRGYSIRTLRNPLKDIDDFLYSGYKPDKGFSIHRKFGLEPIVKDSR